MVYNFFQKKKLYHNVPLFERYGLKKKYFSPVSSEDFKHLKSEFDRKEDIEAVKETSFYKSQNKENQESLLGFFDLGYCIIKNYLDESTVNQINSEIQTLLDSGKIQFKYRNKLMFAIHHSNLIKKIGEDKSLIELLSILFDGKAKLFQSINFINGSEQKTHSDSIHMTTFPLGGLLGVWIALENTDAENGALHYYPKSHRLPYFMNSDYDNVGTKWKLGNKGYAAYEKMLEDKIKSMNLQKEIFCAEKGDMLIWHANILHGGEAHSDKNRTRKSMVFHYFDENAICYHEVTQRPALF